MQTSLVVILACISMLVKLVKMRFCQHIAKLHRYSATHEYVIWFGYEQQNPRPESVLGCDLVDNMANHWVRDMS